MKTFEITWSSGNKETLEVGDEMTCELVANQCFGMALEEVHSFGADVVELKDPVETGEQAELMQVAEPSELEPE